MSDGHDFTLHSDEGLPIRGNLHLPPKMRAIVLVVHGFKGFKDWGFFPWVAERLAAQRLAVCRFNMSRSGIGDDPESFDRLDLFADDTYSIQLADLAVVANYIRQQLPTLPIVLLGHSRGGAVTCAGVYTRASDDSTAEVGLSRGQGRARTTSS